MRWSLALLILAATASAGFLPLIHDRPKRDNPNDPAVKPLALPIASFPTFTPTPTIGTPSATPTVVPTCGGPDTANFGTFETGVESWSGETYAGYTALAVSAGAPSCYGVQALAGTATLTHSGGTLHLAFKKLLAPAQNWIGRSLAARVYFPAGHGASTANLYVKVGAGYSGRSGAAVSSPVGGGWTNLVFDLSSLPPSEAGVIQEIGLDLFSASSDPDGPVTYRLDSVSLLGGPTPTITPTFSASPTVAFGTPTSTGTPTASPSATPSPLPTCGAAVDVATYATFESGTQSWASETYAGYTYMTITASTPACMGSQALCGAANLVHAGGTLHLAFKVDPAAQDLTGKGLEARIYVPAGYGNSSARLYVKTTVSYATQAGPITVLPAGGGWTTLSFGLAALAPADQADVREIGVDVFSGSGDPDGAMSYCLDSVSVR